MISVAALVAGFVGVFTFISGMANILADDLPQYQQGQPVYGGYIGTHYTPQMPPIYNISPAPRYITPPTPAPQYVAPCNRPYCWGNVAYVNAIANTPMVTPTPNYVPYYYGYTVPQPNMPYLAAPKVCEYNVDYSGTRLNQGQVPLQQPAPPGQQPMQQPMPNVAYGNGVQYRYQQTPTYTTQYYRQGPTYNVDYSSPSTNPQCSYNINDGYARTYGNGSVSFCKVPSCYYNNGTWRG